MSYAVPSSGILCLELLRQAANPQRYYLRLEWIQTEASGGNMASLIQKILSRFLERILDPPGIGQSQPIVPFLENGFPD
ncbi:hypothetical protein BO70DRAFT_361001 [Aspergillus heteromorphus CBS 117.55]|uniref:Uncharacterized protein n=1 Tax=Aspergillus heteromorphus CBS 117.55 TaxID=1448321 RepID=A0A317WPG3_9EURO|nr:uncharacterized protein BO70DRAFT_361001 [Aspergillus heteromorphus CBS 117.55]PWY86180.1 hypothetical protein BO70DRAFT_361001 [Aspergillus heteromorphus CBS 117.55]